MYQPHLSLWQRSYFWEDPRAGEVDKDLGVGEGEDLLRKIDSFLKNYF